MNDSSDQELETGDGDRTPVSAVGQRAIVLATHSTDAEFSGECDYAVVQLTPELAERVRRRAALAHQAGQQDESLCELYFWDDMVEYYDAGLLEACQKAIASDEAARQWLNGLEQDGYAIVPAAALAACETQRVECQQMVLHCSPLSPTPHYEIAWSAMPKHMEMTVTTGDLPLDALEAYVRDEKAA